ncbi:hypothetical protein [Corynebacterium sp. H113]|uniref:hypothetical protein n=1 Tax=Corynebacterium sp. H113 TaxID=3133419 RepID=UPI0030A9FE56
MIEKTFTTLIFGNVVLESHLTGCSIRIYSEDLRSYSMQCSPTVELKVPLDEARHIVPESDREALARSIFESVSPYVESSYPGGIEAATTALCRWLAEED